MRRFASRLPCATACVAASYTPSRTFFGKGWDNAALDTVFKAVLKKPAMNDLIHTRLAKHLDSRTLEMTRVAAVKTLEVNKDAKFRVFLPPFIGDAHRVLKAYSLTAYPILDEKGEQMVVEMEGNKAEAFADPDDDYSKVLIPHLDLVEALAQDLLKTMGWEANPRGAASLLESLYRGAEIPDHVFQTEAVIERF